MAVAVTLTALVGASVFADSRPAKETHGGRAGSRVEVRGSRGEGNRSAGGRIQREPSRSTANRNNAPSTSSRRNDSSMRDDSRQRSTPPSTASRSQSNRNDRYDSRNGNRRNDSWRNDNNRRDTARRNDSYRNDNTRNRDSRYGRTSRYDNRPRFSYSGRIHRVNPYNGGYRVWLTGCNYPFFIPSAYYHRDRFRVGLTISLGGFYNSLGYYDYYDDRYDSRYYSTVGVSRGQIEGVVESVDYRRETFVVRNEATGSFVTVRHLDRGRDPVRSGDYVELRGDWTRDGVFEAYGVDILR